MDGLESTTEIRKQLQVHFEKTGKNYTKMPICALTANDTVEDRNACLRSGMSDFLTKPPDMFEFKKILRSVFPNFNENEDD